LLAKKAAGATTSASVPKNTWSTVIIARYPPPRALARAASGENGEHRSDQNPGHENGHDEPEHLVSDGSS
jgi:hypothetical protein